MQENLTPEAVLFPTLLREESSLTPAIAASTPGPLTQGVTSALPCLPGGGGLGMNSLCVSAHPIHREGSPGYPQARQEFLTAHLTLPF